jgi:hypothetical protein
MGYNKDVPDLVVDGGRLNGGRDGSSPQIFTSTRRNFNTNFFVDPVDYRWINTYSDQPNVIVTVDDIPSACNTNCTYAFLNTVPVVDSATLSGFTMSLALTDPGNLKAPLSAIKVTLDNQPCTDLAGTMLSFTCKLPKNTDNTPILTAGSHLPKVTISPVGIVSNNPSLSPITINLLMSSVTTSSGGNNGGYEVTIVGQGFTTDKK